jgi:hypothetical protein
MLPVSLYNRSVLSTDGAALSSALVITARCLGGVRKFPVARVWERSVCLGAQRQGLACPRHWRWTGSYDALDRRPWLVSAARRPTRPVKCHRATASMRAELMMASKRPSFRKRTLEEPSSRHLVRSFFPPGRQFNLGVGVWTAQIRRPFLTHLLMELAFVLDWSPRAHQSRTRLPPPLAIPPIAMGLSLKRNAAGPPGACAKTGSGATSRLTRLYWCHAPLWS